jgi:hypothetical protein
MKYILISDIPFESAFVLGGGEKHAHVKSKLYVKCLCPFSKGGRRRLREDEGVDLSIEKRPQSTTRLFLSPCSTMHNQLQMSGHISKVMYASIN